MSNSVRPHRRQPTRLPRPWDSPGKNTGVGCHFLLQCMKVKSGSEVTQSCLTPRDPMDCSLPGSSVHGIFHARVLKWVAICFSREFSWPRDRTRVSCIVDRRFTVWATREVHLETSINLNSAPKCWLLESHTATIKELKLIFYCKRQYEFLWLSVLPTHISVIFLTLLLPLVYWSVAHIECWLARPGRCTEIV